MSRPRIPSLLAALAVLPAVGLLAGCSQGKEPPASGAEQSSTSTASTSSASATSSTSTSSKGTSSPDDASSPEGEMEACSGSVLVSAGTSCDFGTNVSDAYRLQHPAGGDGTVSAWDPEAKTNRTVSCTSGTPTICRSGDLTVYLQ